MHRALTILTIAAAAFLCRTRSVSADDWPQWRGLHRDGVWNETGILETFPPDGLKIVWRAAVGLGWSSPVVAAGRVYVTDVKLAAPKATERVLCFDAASGKPIWSHEYAAAYPDWAFGSSPDGPRATSIVRDGRLYTLGSIGSLFCFDAANGSVVWQKNLASEYGVKEFTGITASPLIEDDLLILELCAKPDATVVALDKNTGKEIWKTLNDTFTYSSPIVITAGGKRQLIAWTQEAVTALDPKTGATWWRQAGSISGDAAVSTPVFSGGQLLVGGIMFKLDADKPGASIQWPESPSPKNRLLSNTSTALLQGGHIYSARLNGELVCIEAATGRDVWSARTVTSQKSGACIHITPNQGSALLFTDQGDLIRARLAPEQYTELSRAHVIDPKYAYGGRKVVWAAPAYSGGRIFVRNEEELLCASLEK